MYAVKLCLQMAKVLRASPGCCVTDYRLASAAKCARSGHFARLHAFVMRKMLSNFNNYRTGNSVPFIWHYPKGIALQMLKYTNLLPYLWPIGFYAKTSVMILLMDHS